MIEVAGWTSGINAGCYSKSGAALSQPALMSAVLTELCAHQFSGMSSGGQGSCMDQVAGMCASSDITACLVQCSSVNHRLFFYIPLHDVSTVVLITIFFGYIPLHGVSVGTIYIGWRLFFGLRGMSRLAVLAVALLAVVAPSEWL